MFFSYQGNIFFSFREIIYIPRKAEAENEKLDTTEHRLSSLVSAAEEEEIKTNNRMKTISEIPTRKQPKAKSKMIRK